MTPAEKMGEFFDVRAEGYDAHMQENVEGFAPFYEAVTSALPSTDEPLEILDLGIGTGLQIEGLFARLPNARITGIDLSPKMMSELCRKHAAHLAQIRLIHGSFLDIDFGVAAYDAVISVMALHHHPFEEKVGLFQRIRQSLKPGGRFINGDYVVSAEEAACMLATYENAMNHLDRTAGPVHLDIPFSMKDELDVFGQAGFGAVDVPYHCAAAAIFVATGRG